MEEETGLALRDEGLALQPVMNLEIAKQRIAEFQKFVKEYLKEGEDYGTIPGTPKPTLYKPGADKLCELYGIADDYVIVDKIEDFDRGLFDYTIKCILTSKRTQNLVASGMGSCNSFEGRYRWRDAQRVCPQCGKEAIIKGKEEYGGGWLCFKKKDGCGTKFSDTDAAITGQAVGKVENPDMPTLKNTILKMAKKRAKVDATLAATRSSGIFTQDVEDMAITVEGEAHAVDHAAASTPKTTEPHSNNGSSDSLISEGERRKLYAICAKASVSHEDLKQFLKEKFNLESTTKITTKMLPAVTEWLESVSMTP